MKYSMVLTDLNVANFAILVITTPASTVSFPAHALQSQIYKFDWIQETLGAIL